MNIYSFSHIAPVKTTVSVVTPGDLWNTDIFEYAFAKQYK